MRDDVSPYAQLEKVRDEMQSVLERYSNSESIALATASLTEAKKQRDAINAEKSRLFGKKSEFAGLRRMVGRLPSTERAEFVQKINDTEEEFLTGFNAELKLRETFIETAQTARESIDVTIPGRRPRPGHLHPITLLRQRIEDIFVSMGYAIEDDREIETDYYNFDALNIPENHPARESQDTFYTTTGLALRSQTSTVQIRAMERRGVPIRILAPGKVYRANLHG